MSAKVFPQNTRSPHMFLKEKHGSMTKKMDKCCILPCSGGVITYISTSKSLRNPVVRNQVEFCATQYCTKLCHQGTLCSILDLGQQFSDVLFIVHFQILEFGAAHLKSVKQAMGRAGPMFKVSPRDHQNCMVHSVPLSPELKADLNFVSCPDHAFS